MRAGHPLPIHTPPLLCAVYELRSSGRCRYHQQHPGMAFGCVSPRLVAPTQSALATPGGYACRPVHARGEYAGSQPHHGELVLYRALGADFGCLLFCKGPGCALWCADPGGVLSWWCGDLVVC